VLEALPDALEPDPLLDSLPELEARPLPVLDAVPDEPGPDEPGVVAWPASRGPPFEPDEPH
jgi:hypothetical protein